MEKRRNRRFSIQMPVKRWASRREFLFRWAAADFLQYPLHPACVGVAAARFLLREPLHAHKPFPTASSRYEIVLGQCVVLPP